jgi:RNA polymerase primary sigma factor
MLTAAHEAELARRIRCNDSEAFRELVTGNLRFVVSVSKQYQNQGLSLPDLINEGNLGLVRAARRFDETRGFKFISYAVWWIRHSILQALAEHARIVRLPLNRIGNINRMLRTAARLEQELLREPTAAEVARALDTTPDAVEAALTGALIPCSMDAPIGDNDEFTLYDITGDDNSPAPDARLMKKSLATEIERIMASLDSREADILRYSFGLNDFPQCSTNEIARIMGLTKERIRQLREQTIKKLQNSRQNQLLKGYL